VFRSWGTPTRVSLHGILKKLNLKILIETRWDRREARAIGTIEGGKALPKEKKKVLNRLELHGEGFD